jgi:hypothetical protein
LGIVRAVKIFPFAPHTCTTRSPSIPFVVRRASWWLSPIAFTEYRQISATHNGVTSVHTLLLATFLSSNERTNRDLADELLSVNPNLAEL